jgi:hypothetical protein
MAQVVTLTWDPNLESDVAGYNVYYGTSSGQYTERLDVGQSTTATIIDLPSGRCVFFAVTAYNTAGVESDFSEEVCNSTLHFTSYSMAEKGGDFFCNMSGNIGQAFVIETTTNLVDWTAVATNILLNSSTSLCMTGNVSSSGMRFYRARMSE